MIWLFVLTVVGFLVAGWWLADRSRNYDDYILAGRRVPWMLVAGSLAATDIGAGISLGMIQSSANGKGMEVTWLVWMMIPSYIIGCIISPSLRGSGARTIPEFFTLRYGRTSGLMAALLTAIPSLGIVAVNLTVSGHLLSSILGCSFGYSLIIGATITVVYGYAGGLWADIVTDAFQLLFILIGVGLTVAVFHYRVMPVGSVIASDAAGLDRLWPSAQPWELASLFVLYTANFVVGLSTVSRIYAARDAITARKGILACIPVYLVYGLCPPLIGLYLRNLAGSSGPLVVSDSNVITLLIQTLPDLVVAVFSLGIMAAMLSTVDSLLIGTATILVNDIAVPFCAPSLEDSRKLQITRLLVAVLGGTGALVAWLAVDNVLQALFFILTIQTCSLFGPFIFGHYQKWVGAAAANTAIILTTASFLGLHFFVQSDLSLLPFILALVINVSLYWSLGLVSNQYRPRTDKSI